MHSDPETTLPSTTSESLAWHGMRADEVLAAVGATASGLTQSQAQHRLESHGRNELAAERVEPWWEEVLESLREPLQLLLIAVAVLYAFFGRVEDALTILVVIVIVSVVEAANELRAKRAIASLRTLTAPHTVVVRDGAAREIASGDVVAGDIVLLQQGSRVTADLRLLETAALRIDESSLTGESMPVDKRADIAASPGAVLAERFNMAYSGTSVTGGSGRGVVVATGQASELGHIARLAGERRDSRTPLQRQLGHLARVLLWVALAVSAVVPILGVLISGEAWRDMVLSGLTLAFATIPEELPILITIVLGLGAYRLAQQKAITRRLEAAEALGAVTVVGTDKTGTLTENRMRVAQVWVDGAMYSPTATEPLVRRLLEIGALANEAHATRGDGERRFAGDPTDTALLRAAADAGIPVEEPRSHLRIVQRVPFDDARRRMSTIYEHDGRRWLVTKGAPEIVLALCDGVLTAAGERSLDDSARSSALATAEEMAARGLRVLALAQRELQSDETPDRAEVALTLVGLVELEDPPRAEAAPTIAALQAAGVRVVMITGDHPATAASIARQVGIPAERVITGAELARAPDTALPALVESARVFARITPKHKLRIVRALQTAGEVVAVIGDGVNDAPALREATIGIAMGRQGTDVAREAADVVLADDNFATVTIAVKGGRVLFENLRKSVRYYLAAKVALVGSTVVAVLAALPLPFWPVQIIVLELFMDLGASTTFVVEPPEEDVMARPPRDPRRPLLDASAVFGVFAGGLSLAAAVAAAYLWTSHHGASLEAARTTAFSTWMIGHIVLAAHMRAERQPLLAGGFVVTTPFLVWSLAAILLAGLGPLVPVLAQRLSLTPLNANEWAVVLICAVVFPSWIEGAKWWNRRGSRLQPEYT